MQTITISAPQSVASLTKHAITRANQRGLKTADLQLVFAMADQEREAGGGCYKVSLSTQALEELRAEGRVSASRAERLRRIQIVTDGRSIITNYRN